MVFAADTELVGREVEFVRLRDFVREVEEGARAVVVRGEAGIGKTALWGAAVAEAQAAGLTVLSARCVETELPLALVGLSDLLRDVFTAAEADVADHQRAALAIAIGVEAPTGVPPDAIVLSRACLALLHALARKAPVLIAIDDAQWLDEASRRVISFAVRRSTERPVGVLMTQRGDGPDPLDLAHAFDDQHFEEVRLGGLSIGALAHLLRGRLDTRIPRPLLARLHATSGGNPMFALEFARSLLGKEGLSLAPLPFPKSLDELVRERIAGRPAGVRRLLALVAASDRPTPTLLRRIEPAADALLITAVDSGDLVITDDGAVRPSHPLWASAAYAALQPSKRRALHAELAAAVEDVEEQGRHLALAVDEPDADVAAVLDEAAERARARGAPDVAAELAKEAVRLTPPRNGADREERALAVAEYLADAARHVDAAAYLAELLATGLAGPRRARALLLRTWVEHDIDARTPLLEEALRHANDDPRVHARVLLALSTHGLYRPEGEGSEEPARQAVALSEEADDRGLLAIALATVGSRTETTLGHPHWPTLERALELGVAHHPPSRLRTARMLVAEANLREGRLARARELLEAELDAVVREGREWDRARVLVGLGLIEWRAGRWEEAARYVDDLRDLATDGGDVTGEAWALLGRARLAGARGLVEDARQLIDEVSGRSRENNWSLAFVRWELGSLELSLGRFGPAWQALSDVARSPSEQGIYMEALHALPDACEAAIALGLVDDSESLARELETRARSGNVWAGPAASRCRALLLLARGDAKGAESAAAEAARGFAAAGFPLDRGRALLVAGEALRRAGKRRLAAEKLETARAIFTELGAALWVERVENELRRARPRPRRDRELTNAERRVAALVADGRTNAEVASQLFTTVATVEAHLTRIYRKLGVRSRTELARGVADGTISLTDE